MADRATIVETGRISELDADRDIVSSPLAPWRRAPRDHYTPGSNAHGTSGESALQSPNSGETIPVGPDNTIQPGPDRGQPTVFETAGRRRLAFAFKVDLPADWPKERELVWTVTANGATFTAIGRLWPVWLVNDDVIATNRGSQRIYAPKSTNTRPVVTQAAQGGTVAVGQPLTLTMSVTDDGLPRTQTAWRIRARRRRRSDCRSGRCETASDAGVAEGELVPVARTRHREIRS
jgi:hypothetical protein